MDDVQTLWPDIEEAFEVTLRFRGNRDDRIRHFERGLFQPHREIVAAAELLALPWPQWLERVDRNHQRNAVVLLRENSAEVGIPSVTMDQVGVDVGGVKIDAAFDRGED